MSSVKEIIKHITNHTNKLNIERHNTLNTWLDYMIEYFDISQYRTPEGWAQMQDKKYRESPDLYTATYMWMDITATDMEAYRTSDILGTVYEELFQSKGKASSLGQFFTPLPICDMLSQCTWQNNQKRFNVNDCSCGSGRTLVSHYMEKLRRNNHTPAFYIGEDIDITSVKMCALNMMIHGMHGRAVRHDTLMEPVSFDYGFEINEVRYPFPTPFYSLRPITYQETEEQRKARLLEPIGTKKTPIAIDPPIKPIKSTKTTPKPQETTVLPLTKPDKDGQYSLF